METLIPVLAPPMTRSQVMILASYLGCPCKMFRDEMDISETKSINGMTLSILEANIGTSKFNSMKIFLRDMKYITQEDAKAVCKANEWDTIGLGDIDWANFFLDINLNCDGLAKLRELGYYCNEGAIRDLVNLALPSGITPLKD